MHLIPQTIFIILPKFLSLVTINILAFGLLPDTLNAVNPLFVIDTIALALICFESRQAAVIKLSFTLSLKYLFFSKL